MGSRSGVCGNERGEGKQGEVGACGELRRFVSCLSPPKGQGVVSVHFHELLIVWSRGSEHMQSLR